MSHCSARTPAHGTGQSIFCFVLHSFKRFYKCWVESLDPGCLAPYVCEESCLGCATKTCAGGCNISVPQQSRSFGPQPRPRRNLTSIFDSRSPLLKTRAGGRLERRCFRVVCACSTTSSPRAAVACIVYNIFHLARCLRVSHVAASRVRTCLGHCKVRAAIRHKHSQAHLFFARILRARQQSFCKSMFPSEGRPNRVLDAA